METRWRQAGLVVLAILALLGLFLFQYLLFLPFFTSMMPFSLAELGSLERDDLSIYSEEGYFRDPQFAFGGEHILYLASVRPEGKTEAWETDIWVMDRDGKNQTRLTRVGDIDRIRASPASDRIAYTHYDAGRISVFLASSRGAPPVSIPGPVPFTYFSSWNPDGERMAATGIDPAGWNGFWILPDGNQTPAWGYGTRSRLYILDAGGGDPVEIGNITLPDSYDHFVETDWSPDGTRVAFPYDDEERAAGIAVADPASGRVTRLTADGGTFPRWSPDGGLIAYLVAGSVHTVRPDGSGGRRIVNDGTADALSWNPAGTRIAYSNENMIGIIDPDGTNLTPLGNIHPGPVSWSPDGRTVTYSPGVGVRIRIQTLSLGVVKMGGMMSRSIGGPG